MNPKLEAALQKAKYESLPKLVVDKAIAKWAGMSEGGEMQEIFYECYGPGGSALYIKILTDNANRAAANMRILLGKSGYALATPWSVGRQFQEKWVILIDGIEKNYKEKGREKMDVLPFVQETLELFAIDLAIEDIDFDEWVCVITTSKEDFLDVKNTLEKQSYHINDADLKWLADNTISLSDGETEKFDKLIDLLEEDEDVDNVYHNVE